MITPTCDVVTPERFGTGEGPLWDSGSGRLFWTSIGDGEIHAVDPRTGAREVWRFEGEPVGSFGLCRSGRLVVALRDSVVLYERSTGKSELLARTPLPIAEARLNDGKVGPDGAFWVGSMDERSSKEPIGKLFRIAPSGEVEEICDGLKVSNGLAWSPEGSRMYHADSRGPWIDVWDFDPATGRASNRRRFADLDDAAGRPDGGACDIEGGYWSAGPSASVVNRFAPDGSLLETYKVPNHRPTMPCFGGPDLRRLYVTSLSAGVSEELLEKHPLCGKTVAFDVDVAGAPVAMFAD